MRASTGGNELTTIQISKKILARVRAHCKKEHYIQRYWFEELLDRALKEEGAANRSRSQL